MALAGCHTNGTRTICDSSEWNAEAQGCLCGTHAMRQLDLGKANAGVGSQRRVPAES